MVSRAVLIADIITVMWPNLSLPAKDEPILAVGKALSHKL
ncbi:hypothetical protein APHMUC_0472 [Anaplasma phagocytophilum str. ApMUC09]|uniref:Uncharacterized protein n=1 Tax=Anaplasma phagocytophilum str. ApMUC09 TaxID=1359152 RepID=A0A0F3N6M2_ANAPH|nr:hypothetical protein APHMUC_0472 [Anaplasma phagocytophilum str. ApMUC09]